MAIGGTGNCALSGAAPRDVHLGRTIAVDRTGSNATKFAVVTRLLIAIAFPLWAGARPLSRDIFTASHLKRRTEGLGLFFSLSGLSESLSRTVSSDPDVVEFAALSAMPWGAVPGTSGRTSGNSVRASAMMGHASGFSWRDSKQSTGPASTDGNSGSPAIQKSKASKACRHFSGRVSDQALSSAT